MKILHICSDFSGSKVHYNLYRKLDNLIEHQTVYAYYDSNEIKASNYFRTSRSEVIYADILNRYLRKIYPLRESWVLYNLKRNVNTSEYDCIHATTLFGDGGIAYKLNKQFGVPYIVAVRSTDISYIYKYPKILSSYAKRIIRNASAVVFINKVTYDRLEAFGPLSKVWSDKKDKIIIIPNGIDDYWINNLYGGVKINNHRICYAGLFYKRKNILRLIEAVGKLRLDFPDVQLYIVGDNGPDETEIKRLAEVYDFIHLSGRIADKTEMLNFYRSNSIFAMPSWGETFGLVYVEALTQKMRILYSKDEGVDGLFQDVGVAVNPFSVDDILTGLKKLMTSYECFDGTEKMSFSNFRWDYIAGEYMRLYQNAVEDSDYESS